MALTRKYLSAMGIEDDKAEMIINAHLEVVNPIKQERDELRDKAAQLDDVQKQLDKAGEKLKEFENSDSTDSWKVKHDAIVAEKKQLMKEFEDYKSEVASKELTAKKKEAYRTLLKEAGVSDKRLDSVLKVSDFNAIEFLEDGSVKDADKLSETIKGEWQDFIGQVGRRGADVATPQGTAGNGNLGNPDGGKPLSRGAMLAQKYKAEHYGS